MLTLLSLLALTSDSPWTFARSEGQVSEHPWSPVDHRSLLDVLPAGDVDGDGFDDVAVVTCAPFLCGDLPMLASLVVVSGRNLAAIGRLDVPDQLLVCRSTATGAWLLCGHEMGGSTRVELRPSLEAAPTWAHGRRAGSLSAEPLAIGRTGAFVGDVDGDGTEDVVLGDAWAKDPTGVSRGAIALVSGATGELLWRDSPATLSGYALGPRRSMSGAFGRIVAPVGDIDGDGATDFATIEDSPTQGREYTHALAYFSGASGRSIPAPALAAQPHYYLDAALDFDGDGHAELVVDGQVAFGARIVSPRTGTVLATASATHALAEDARAAWYVVPADPERFARWVIVLHGPDGWMRTLRVGDDGWDEAQ